MDSKKLGSFTQLRSKLTRLLRMGGGSLVLATAVVTSQPADAAIPPADDASALEERTLTVRAQLKDEMPAPQAATDGTTRLAWWGNWHNWGWHPGWHNWPNWRNWHNWPNWRNF